MNHKYLPSQIDSTKCQICKYDVMSHTDLATCDACPTIGPVEIYMTMKMCPSCIEKETKLQKDSKEKESERVEEVLGRAKDIDYSIEVKEDIFNAETVSFNDIKVALEADVNMVNKPYELAKIVKDRILHFSKVIFDKQDEIRTESTKQRFWQEQANQLASQLRQKEREELKLENINYKPVDGKVAKIKPVSTTGKKYDKVELVEWANKGGWPLSVLQGVCVAKGMNPEQAYTHLKSKGL